MRCSTTIALVAVLLFFYSHASAQEVDSLKKILPHLTDTARIDCLNELTVRYLFKPDEDSCSYYSTLVYEESKKLLYIHGIATSFIMKAAIQNHFHNNYPKMEEFAKESVKWFNLTANKKYIPIPYWQLSIAQCNQGNYDEALLNAKLCYDWAKKERDTQFVKSSLEAMTDVYRWTGQYDKLFDAQYELVKGERMSGNTNEYTFHELWVMGLMYMLLEEYETALPFWRKLFLETMDYKSIGIWNQTEYAQLLTLSNHADSALYYYNQFDSAKAETKDLRYFLVGKGEYYLFLKQYNTALPYFLEGLKYHRRLNARTQVKRTLLDIAKTYAALQKNDSAISYSREGLTMALLEKSKPAIRDGYQILFSVYDQLHQPDSANFYFRKYVSAKDSELNDQMKGRVVTYNFQQKIASLNRNKLSQQQQLQKEKTNRNILIAALIIFLSLAAFIIRNVQLKRRKDQLQHLMTEANTQLENRRKEQQLAEIQQQKTELEMQALRAQMNPHFIFNSLNSINMFILENNKLQASEYLSKFSRLIRLILQNSQEALVPLEKELEALQLYLELESLRFENKFEYKISIDEAVDMTMLKVPPLIIQPYVENAIWHGLMHKKQKGHLEVELYRDAEILFCKIVDDGIGRERAAALKSKSASLNKSMGMRITADRIAMMQQKNQSDIRIVVKDLVLADGTPGGTEVLLKIPVTDQP